MKMFTRSLAVLSVCFAWALVCTAADDVQTLLHAGSCATMIIEHESIGGDHGSRSTTKSPATLNGRGNGEIIWHNTFSEAFYQSTSISMTTARLCAGTWLNPPKEAEVIPLEGDGTPDWVYPGSNFRVAASRNGDVIAGVDTHENGITLYKWHATSSIPDWSHEVPSAMVAGVRCVIVSPDASTIGLVVTMQDPQYVRFYCFDAESPVPIGTFDAEEGTSAGNIDITADGRYITFYALADAYVFDRDAAALRWSGSMGGGNTPLAISGDGNYIAYGWMSLYVRVWNGSSYAILWSAPGGDFWVRSCRFSYDGNTLAVGWYDHNTYLKNKIQLFEMPFSIPLWTYNYESGAGEYQDIPYEMAVTRNGGHVVVGSWGDEANTNPEIHVFEHHCPDPVLTVDTPGSMFSVDIAEDGRGSVYIAACGKHIHANENGRGGDLYSIRLTNPAAVGDSNDPPRMVFEVRPNPFTQATTAHFTRAGSGSTRLMVYSLAGRLLRVLETSAEGEGTGSVTWDGRIRGEGLAAPGVYFMRMEAGDRSLTQRVVRID